MARFPRHGFESIWNRPHGIDLLSQWDPSTIDQRPWRDCPWGSQLGPIALLNRLELGLGQVGCGEDPFGHGTAIDRPG